MSQTPAPINYKGHVIEPVCRELEDKTGWTVGCNIVIHHGGETRVQSYDSDLVKPSLKQAEQAAIQLGMSAIDRSPILR
jgi:hypothetical protein